MVLSVPMMDFLKDIKHLKMLNIPFKKPKEYPMINMLITHKKETLRFLEVFYFLFYFLFFSQLLAFSDSKEKAHTHIHTQNVT